MKVRVEAKIWQEYELTESWFDEGVPKEKWIEIHKAELLEDYSSLWDGGEISNIVVEEVK